MADEAPVSTKDVMRYATEQLHALRPQPPGIPAMLTALKNALDTAEEEALAESKEDPPKDVDEAISRIEAKVAKVPHPPKAKVDLKAQATTSSGAAAATTEGTAKGAKVAKG